MIAKTLFSDPNLITATFGDLTIEADLVTSEWYPNTSVAFSNVGEAIYKDELGRKDGIDNFTLSLERLINALDTFVREHTGKTPSDPRSKPFDLQEPSEWTLNLLWNIRHVWTHKGGLVDDKCKRDYARIFSEGVKTGLRPVVSLPETLELDRRFQIGFDHFDKIRDCVVRYVKKRASAEDFKILMGRMSLQNPRFKGVTYRLGLVNWGIVLSFDYSEAYAAGFRITPEDPTDAFPPQTQYDFESERIVLPSGESFRAVQVQEKKKTLADVRALDAKYRGKLGRNDPCTCGSGKKFKNCCLKFLRPSRRKI